MTRSLRAVALAGVLGFAAPLLVTATAVAAPTTPATTGVATATVAAASATAKHITVPKNYVYNPKAKHQRTLHDYCTKSPDEFPAPGTNANFRGPCARHDMCIQYRQATKRSVCDSRLLANLKSECRWTYSGRFDLRRGACLTTAHAYWLVVRARTATGAPY
ncbi:MAG: hypothetical protein ACR2LI_15130 [Propionibacteriaceae bacterium]